MHPPLSIAADVFLSAKTDIAKLGEKPDIAKLGEKAVLVIRGCASSFIFVTIGQYRYSLGWPTIGRGGLRALWHVDRDLSWPTIALFGRLPRQPSAVCVWHILGGETGLRQFVSGNNEAVLHV